MKCSLLFFWMSGVGRFRVTRRDIERGRGVFVGFEKSGHLDSSPQVDVKDVPVGSLLEEDGNGMFSHLTHCKRMINTIGSGK